MGTLVIVPVVALPAVSLYEDPLALIIAVWIDPSIAAFFTVAVVESPQFFGKGIYVSVENLTTSAGEIV